MASVTAITIPHSVRLLFRLVHILADNVWFLDRSRETFHVSSLGTSLSIGKRQ